ncbi:hypothetical protein AB0O52_10525 [Arthrobacter sp. NPDC080073]|uniref:hypothetical protein n=1 Tax=Arthrobacter sp. NPDC080073 TaxID=3155919 RepID=UPI003416AE4A
MMMNRDFGRRLVEPATVVAARVVTATATQESGLLGVQTRGEAAVLRVGNLRRMTLRIIGADGRIDCEQAVEKCLADQPLSLVGPDGQRQGLVLLQGVHSEIVGTSSQCEESGLARRFAHVLERRPDERTAFNK